jgi:hypothetical protein
MLDKDEVIEIVEAYHAGEADLQDLQYAFEDWDGDPFEVL